MNTDQRAIRRKLRILNYADEIGSVVKTYRYFGIGRASFYRWRTAYQKHGETGLIDKPPIPKWHANGQRQSEEKQDIPRQNLQAQILNQFIMPRLYK